MHWCRVQRGIAAALLALMLASSALVVAMQGGGIPPGRMKLSPSASARDTCPMGGKATARSLP